MIEGNVALSVLARGMHLKSIPTCLKVSVATDWKSEHGTAEHEIGPEFLGPHAFNHPRQTRLLKQFPSRRNEVGVVILVPTPSCDVGIVLAGW